MCETLSWIDAYCHVGVPRFGSAEDAWAMLKRVDVEKVVFVLGPGVPDYATLFRAIRDDGDHVRGIGIPFGETVAQVRASVLLQLRAGVIGLRVPPRALLTYPDIGTLLGEQGRWLYAIGAVSSPEVVEALLLWLQRYPEARVGAPHFLQPGPLLSRGIDGQAVVPPSLVRELVRHPRFYAIFSRHGGVESELAYPHRDLLPWVREVVDLCGWDHVMWGSEYPVLYWRDETLTCCQAWLRELFADAVSPSGAPAGSVRRPARTTRPPSRCSRCPHRAAPAGRSVADKPAGRSVADKPAGRSVADKPAGRFAAGKPAVSQFAAYAGGNAQRALFDVAPPPFEDVAIPEWVATQFDHQRTVHLFPEGLAMPMSDYAALHHRYVKRAQGLDDLDMSFAEFVLEELRGRMPLVS